MTTTTVGGGANVVPMCDMAERVGEREISVDMVVATSGVIASTPLLAGGRRRDAIGFHSLKFPAFLDAKLPQLPAAASL